MSQKTDAYSNPPFDDRIWSVAKLEPTRNSWGIPTGDLQRGYIIQDKGGGIDPKVQYSVRFLYNPSSVSVSHGTDVQYGAAITPAAYRNPADGGNFNIPVQASVGFNLLFDRTYELWDYKHGNANPNDRTPGPNQIGVAVDVEAVYRVVGILQPKTKSIPAVDPYNKSMLSQGSIGPMPMTPCTVFFGGSNSLSYHGYISNLEINYAHFSQNMVPMRCTVGVTMNLIPAFNWEAQPRTDQ